MISLPVSYVDRWECEPAQSGSKIAHVLTFATSCYGTFDAFLLVSGKFVAYETFTGFYEEN